MPTSNFSFPGVTLEQIFVPRPTGTQATLGTVCLGPVYDVHAYGYTDGYEPITNWPNGASNKYALPGYSADNALVLDTAGTYDKLAIVNGLWSYADQKTGTLTISGSGLTRTYTITFGDSKPSLTVNGKTIAKGDLVNIGIASLEDVVAVISNITEDTSEVGKIAAIEVDNVPYGAASTNQATVDFCIESSVTLAGATELSSHGVSLDSDGNVTIPASLVCAISDPFNVKTDCTLKACGTMYYDWRALNTKAKKSLGIVENTTDIVEQLGPVTNANPLAQVVSCALLAGGGYAIYWVGTGADGDGASVATAYLEALDYLGDNASVYNVVPATNNEDVIRQLTAEVERIGSDEHSKVRRTLWYGIDTPDEIFVIKSLDATISGHDEGEATESTLLEATSATVAETATTGQYTVTYAEGTLDDITLSADTDVVRISNVDYSVVSQAADEVTIQLGSGQTLNEGSVSAAIIRLTVTYTSWLASYETGTPLAGKSLQRGDLIRIGSVDYAIIDDNGSDIVEFSKETSQAEPTIGVAVTSIIRSEPTDSQKIDAIIAKCVTASFRAQCVWSDDPLFNGEHVHNYCIAAAAAGMRTAEEPWRPLSNLSYSFFSLDEPNGFGRSQLERLGANGVWIVANNDNMVAINKKSITSIATNDINTTSESIVANADEIAIVLSRVGEELVGSSNISDMLLIVLKDGITNLLDARCTNATSAYVGNQLIGYEIIDIYQDPVNQDEVKADIELEPPKPFNKFRITMRIV